MPRRRFPAFCLAAAAMSTLALGACDPLASENEIQSTHTYEVSQSVTKLVVQNSAGDVLLTNSSTNNSTNSSTNSSTNTGINVTERWSYSGTPPTSTHDIVDGTLTLTYSCPDSSDCGIDYTVDVPSGVASQVTDSAGDVTLSGIGGDVSVLDTAGDIDGSDLASSQVKLNDTAGDITLGFSAAPTFVNAQDSAGDIQLTVPGSADYAVTATASAGNTNVDVPQEPGSKHLIQADDTAGDVTVRAN